MRALICGIGGQDGAYLAQFLLERGYAVAGTSRDAQRASFANLQRLGVHGQISLHSMAANDFRSVLQTLTRTEPDEIYNLTGQSSVSLSFDQPVETMESISIATLNLLEAMRFLNAPLRLYSAGSSECFGALPSSLAATEDTPFKPRSPYAFAKAAAFWEVANYREAYGMFACTGILFNHESPLRPHHFVTRKIIASACRIARGHPEPLVLGNLAITRDWGWAPEYVQAMWTMLQQPQPDDFVIATGVSHTLEQFLAAAFGELGLDWHDHVQSDPNLLRPSDLPGNRADPSKAWRQLGWKAQVQMPEVVQRMIRAELAELARGPGPDHPASLV